MDYEVSFDDLPIEVSFLNYFYNEIITSSTKYEVKKIELVLHSKN